MTHKNHWGDLGDYFASMQGDWKKEPLAPAMHEVNTAAPHCHCAQQSMPSQKTQAIKRVQQATLQNMQELWGDT